MRFTRTDEQQGFAEVLDDLLGAAGTPTTVRRWADGDHADGLRLWRRLADLGVTGLMVGEEQGGLAASPVDLVVAFEALGRHVVPGPWVESVALAPPLLAAAGDHDATARIAAGDHLVSAAVTGFGRHGLDADVATGVLVLDGTRLSCARVGDLQQSMDPARRLFALEATDAVAELSEPDVRAAVDRAVLACSAQLLGAGEHLLAESVAYAKARTQFGRAIGSYQALKHALADVRVALDFARPLVHVAALGLGAGSPEAGRDVSAAKISAGTAADLAARTALQVHGAIGFTAEHDLSLWLLKVRALVNAWGTPAHHRARVLGAITREAAVV